MKEYWVEVTVDGSAPITSSQMADNEQAAVEKAKDMIVQDAPGGVDRGMLEVVAVEERSI